MNELEQLESVLTQNEQVYNKMAEQQLLSDSQPFEIPKDQLRAAARRDTKRKQASSP